MNTLPTSFPYTAFPKQVIGYDLIILDKKWVSVMPITFHQQLFLFTIWISTDGIK